MGSQLMSRLIFPLTIWLCCLPFASAQPRPLSAASEQASVFTSNTQLVSVGIVVTSKDGKPIHDLDVSEVRIKDDGRLQKIRSFEQSDGVSDSGSARGAQGLPDGYRSNRRVSGSSATTVVLLIDNLNTPFEDQAGVIRVAQQAMAGNTELPPIQGALLLDRRGLRVLATVERASPLMGGGPPHGSVAGPEAGKGSGRPSLAADSFNREQEARIRLLTTLGAFRGIAQSLR